MLVYLDGGDLKEIALATGAERLLEDLATPIEDFLVSEDSSMLLLQTAGNTFSLPILGGTPTDLGIAREPLRISPDGSWALLDDLFNDYWLVSTDGQVARELDDFGLVPKFTGDSRYLVYQDSASSPRELRSYELATEITTHLDDGLVRPPGSSGLQSWNVGAHDVIFTYLVSLSVGRNLYRVSADGTGLVTALGPPVDGLDLREIQLSPDGRHAVFEVVNGDDSSLRDLYHATTTDDRSSLLLDDADEAVFLGFSPDSSMALYQNQMPEYSSALMVAPTNGVTPFALTPADFGDVQGGLDFGPGNNTLTFRVKRHDERIELHALDLDEFLLFADGFESGDLSAWAGVFP